jgi:hypothetical protein
MSSGRSSEERAVGQGEELEKGNRLGGLPKRQMVMHQFVLLLLRAGLNGDNEH